MKAAFVGFICLAIITLSCKKTKEDGKICFSRTSSQLQIENHTRKTFHFAAFDQESLAFINWGPFCKPENEMPANSTIDEDLSAIYGYSDNNPLVVYWWECDGDTAGEIQYVVLNKNQTVCR